MLINQQIIKELDFSLDDSTEQYIVVDFRTRSIDGIYLGVHIVKDRHDEFLFTIDDDIVAKPVDNK